MLGNLLFTDLTETLTWIPHLEQLPLYRGNSRSGHSERRKLAPVHLPATQIEKLRDVRILLYLAILNERCYPGQILGGGGELANSKKPER